MKSILNKKDKLEAQKPVDLAGNALTGVEKVTGSNFKDMEGDLAIRTDDPRLYMKDEKGHIYSIRLNRIK